MKKRRHHNNKGLRQIKCGKTAVALKAICRKLGLRLTLQPMRRQARDG